MELKKSKLVKLPSLFEEHPNLLEKVFEVELVKKETGIDSNMRRLYTKCDCSTGDFYWQDEEIGGHDVEIMGCDSCGNWTLQVTY